MNVLMISKDNKILDKNSAVFLRMKDFSSVFDELHIFIVGKIPKKIDQEGYGGKLFIHNTTSSFLPFSFLKVFINSIKTGKRMERERLWVTSQDPFETGLLSISISKILKANLQFQIHTDFLSPFFKKESLINRLRVFIARRIIPKADSIRVVSESIKSTLINDEYLKSTAPKITVLPVFIDQQNILNESIKLNLKNKFPNKYIILMVCRLEIEKNISLAIESFEKFNKENTESVLIIAGEGGQKERLELMVNKNNVNDKVNFLGFVDDVYSLYKTADVLLVTSDYEGYGMNMIEARICNCPVISTDVGVAREIGATIVSRDADFIVSALKNSNQKQQPIQLMDFSEYKEIFKKTFL